MISGFLKYGSMFYRVCIPKKIRISIRIAIKFFYYKFRYIKIKIYLKFTKNNINLIVGAALTTQRDWFSTNEEWLDVTNANHWNRLFNREKRIERILSEHVFEHLTINEMRVALRLIYDHMILGGTLRIAVPDGNHPSDIYRKHCGINGIGADANDHKQFLTFEKLSLEAEKCGFQCYLIEGYKANKKLVKKYFNNDRGRVIRTRNNLLEEENKDGWYFEDANTSLIIDCLKPTS